LKWCPQTGASVLASFDGWYQVALLKIILRIGAPVPKTIQGDRLASASQITVHVTSSWA